MSLTRPFRGAARLGVRWIGNRKDLNVNSLTKKNARIPLDLSRPGLLIESCHVYNWFTSQLFPILETEMMFAVSPSRISPSITGGRRCGYLSNNCANENRSIRFAGSYAVSGVPLRLGNLSRRSWYGVVWSIIGVPSVVPSPRRSSRSESSPPPHARKARRSRPRCAVRPRRTRDPIHRRPQVARSGTRPDSMSHCGCRAGRVQRLQSGGAGLRDRFGCHWPQPWEREQRSPDGGGNHFF